jgi:hypothetical protein
MRLAAAAALIALPLTAACSAQPATRAFPVPGFTRLRVEGPLDVRVRTGGRASVNARGPQARIDKVIVEPRGDTLVVTGEKGWSSHGLSWGTNEKVIVEIGVPTLSSAQLTGSGDLHIDHIRGPDFSALLTGSGDIIVDQVETARLRVDVNGSGDITISGHAGTADAAVHGSGDLRAGSLTVGLLNTALAGSGDINIGATRSARGNLAGSGDIRLGGRPTCQIAKTGSGDVRCGD